MTCREKLSRAMDLLQRIEDREISAPDEHWYRDYYLLTGNHMIFTDQGWLSGEEKENYKDDSGHMRGILAEVNAPIYEDEASTISNQNSGRRPMLSLVRRS